MIKGANLRNLESKEQVTLFNWAGYQSGRMPELKLLHHIPNGGKRDINTAKRLKAEGVKAGVPDICLPVSRGKYHGLYIELKAGKNKPTKLQKEWLNALNDQDYLALVCYGWKHAAEIIEAYLEINEGGTL